MTPIQPGESAERWIFLLRVKNRPGVLAAVASVIADRGISIETVTAHDSSRTGAPYGTVLMTFAASAAKKNYLARLLTRTETVQDIVQYRYDDDAHARKSILIRVTLAPEDLTGSLPPDILCDIVSATEGETLALLVGPPARLDMALSALMPEHTLQTSEPNITVISPPEK